MTVLRVLHHMVVGDDGAVRVDDEAGALGLNRLRLLRRAKAERKAGDLRKTWGQAGLRLTLAAAIVVLVVGGLVELKMHIDGHHRRGHVLHQPGEIRHRGEALLHGSGFVQR